MLREHFDMKTLTLISAGKICCSLRTVMINLAKALSCSLASFHYFFMNSFVDGFNSMILLFFSWDFNFIILLFSS